MLNPDKGAEAILNGIKLGRRGLGSLFIFGSGNGHIDGDNCGADGYANSMYTITFAAADYNGKKAMYCGRFNWKKVSSGFRDLFS